MSQLLIPRGEEPGSGTLHWGVVAIGVFIPQEEWRERGLAGEERGGDQTAAVLGKRDSFPSPRESEVPAPGASLHSTGCGSAF